MKKPVDGILPTMTQKQLGDFGTLVVYPFLMLKGKFYMHPWMRKVDLRKKNDGHRKNTKTT